ncbi:hypothetical protein [Xanthomarina sp. GH4-25]|uniref:hypothetical protein n=1 Tax=Xanthomarina sp. GH4-25 TaxID=3349335 RepID=UPI000D677CAA|nr:hypothetical protein DI383_13950 [Flavobacteriaceae bacterium LYZ1037]
MDLTDLNIKLNPLKDGATTEGDITYLLFSQDKSKAEIFLPKKDKGLVLAKTNEGNWANKGFILISWKGYVLQKDGIAVFGGQ